MNAATKSSPTTTADFAAEIARAQELAEPVRSALLRVLAESLRKIAWRSSVRPFALELAGCAEGLIDHSVDLLAGMDLLAERGEIGEG